MYTPPTVKTAKSCYRPETLTGIAVVLALALTFILFSLSAHAQTKASHEQPETIDLPTPDLWLKPGPGVQQVVSMQATQRIPSPVYAANYALPDQQVLRTNLQRGYTPAAGQTIALVLVPNFETPNAEAFLHMGNVAVYADHSRNGYASEAHDFEKDQPVILVFRTNPIAGYGKTAGGPVQFGDTNLFDVAEVCVYNQLLSDDQTRHLETYLALKYSINISHNKEARYRNYFTAEQATRWYSPTEGRYNQQILGIGRLDGFNWYQTQTQTNEKLPFTLALEQVKPQGEMPEVTLADNSYLIASKSSSYATENCPAPVSKLPFYGWKLKRSAWQSSAKYLHLSAVLMPGAAATSSDTVLLSDGTHNYYLPVNQSGKHVKLTIPLALLQDDISYFLLPTDREALCEENNRVAVDSINNTIGLYINPEMLPLTADLLGLSNQSTAHYTVTDPFAVINTVSSGQYHSILTLVKAPFALTSSNSCQFFSSEQFVFIAGTDNYRITLNI